jgi:peptide/nickel transport system permease protein
VSEQSAERNQQSAGAHERAERSEFIRQQKTEHQIITSLKLLFRIPYAVGGMAVLALLALSAIFAPFITPYDFDRMNTLATLQSPNADHWLGTDLFGRDQLTRILHGGRISLMVGLIAVSIGTTIGLITGAIAGYVGGWTDEVISRIYDIMLAFPGILLAVAVIAVLGPNLFNLMIAIGIGTVPAFGRLTRGQFISLREADYVLAARTIGVTHVWILVKHIFPNAMAPIIVLMTLSVASAILSSAALNYLGLGASPPTPEWGLMLAESRDYIRHAWWLAAFPGVAIMITVLAINAVGDGLRDAFDPWLRGK